MPLSSVRDIIRAARDRRSQAKLAEDLEITQSTVSRYENGKANPPAAVLEYCMRLVHDPEFDDSPSAEHIAVRVRREFGGAEQREIRILISRLLDALAPNRYPHRREA